MQNNIYKALNHSSLCIYLFCEQMERDREDGGKGCKSLANKNFIFS
jgi:hypothetical protein